MTDLLDIFDDVHDEASPRLGGVMPAVVVDNFDLTCQGRVQVRLPWIPGIEPWARVCSPFAGDGRGMWAIPQVDDEVLVAFAGGDVAHAYVLGGLWSMTASPPDVDLPTDAVTKRVIKSPLGHVVTIDDAEQKITLESLLGHRIEIGPEKIELAMAGGMASITLDVKGGIQISGKTSVDITALKTEVTGTASAKVGSSGSVEMSGGASCRISAGLVAIN